MKSEKGFTLIELIAVIVILGVVVLIATTSIGPLITRARKDALGEEGLHMIEAAKYAHKLDEIDEANNIKGSKSICYSLKWLNENDYYDKGEKEGYTGSVLIEYDEETGSYSYKFWLSNGTYVFNNVDEKDYDSELATEGKEAINNCEGLSKKLPSYTYPDPEPEPEPEPDPEPEPKEKPLDVCTSPGVIKHDKTIDVNGDGTPDDAGDGGCRYSGNNPNNFICFGPGSESYNNGTFTSCPDANLYRIIGYVPVTLSNGTKTKLIKVIKSEYATSADLGISSQKSSLYYYNYNYDYSNLKRVKRLPSGLFFWRYVNIYYDEWDNTWSNSTLYQALNSGFVNTLEDNWANKIENVQWNVGGYDETRMRPKETYTKENDISYGAKTKVNAKIGLMYSSDYGFASSNENWLQRLYLYFIDDNIENNWLFNGVYEWTISRDSDSDGYVWTVAKNGDVGVFTTSDAAGVRPVFYLKSSVTIKAGDEIDGSDSKPFKVS